MWKSEKAISGGHVRLPSCGDSFMDKWESEIEKNIFPDLVEGLPEPEQASAREAIELERQKMEEKDKKRLQLFMKSRKVQEHEYKRMVEELAEFEDKY